MINTDALIDVAQRRGYRVRWHRGGPKAAWLPHRSTITLRVGMDDVTTLCSLAHELGHAHYGDPPGHFGAHELRADRFAARLLINEDDYRQAESTYGTDVETLAFILNVSPGLIEAWREYLARRGNPSSRS